MPRKEPLKRKARRSDEEKSAMLAPGKTKLVSKLKPFNLVISQEDDNWLVDMCHTLRKERRVSRSELVRLGLALLREKNETEIMDLIEEYL